MNVTLLPDLFPAAHRAGVGDLFRVWTLARHYAPAPGTRIAYDELLDAMCRDLDIRVQQAVKLIARGDGDFWRVAPGYVYLVGAKPLLAKLNGTPSDALPVTIPLDKFAKLKTFYAACYAAYLQRYTKGDTTRPVSRAHLRQVFGVTKNTLRSWEKTAHVTILANYAFARPTDFSEMPDRPFEYHCLCGRVFANGLDMAAHHTECTQEFIVVWQRPNSYTPPPQGSTGTANPLGRKRFMQYLQRQKHPVETICPETRSAHALTYRPTWLTFLHATTYRTSKISDPLPPVLLACNVPMARLWRAVGK